MSDAADSHGMRSKSDAELEAIALATDLHAPSVSGAARAELARRRRGHERALVDKQLQAAERQLIAAADTAKATKWAMIAAWGSTIGALLSAAGAFVQAVK